jgi:hypothetical protein
VHQSAYEVTLDFALVDAGLETATPVVRIDLPHGGHEEILDRLREGYHDWQVAHAMRAPDGTAVRLADGTWAFAGHRRIRDGARVALVTVPGLLRFDLHRRSDSFSFHVRDLGGGELDAPIQESGPGAAPAGPDGAPRNAYTLRMRTTAGTAVRIVAHIAPYTGALETDNSAVALVREP